MPLTPIAQPSATATPSASPSPVASPTASATPSASPSPSPSPPQSPSITKYSLSAHPYDIALGPDGALWFTNVGGTIGHITTAGVSQSYAIPTQNSYPEGITDGPDGALWFTDANVGRVTTAGVVTHFAIAPGSGPSAIIKDPDGALRFAELGSNAIGRVTTSGVFQSYALSSSAILPLGIVAGSDGALWFTESNIGNRNQTTGGYVGRISDPFTATSRVASQRRPRPTLRSR